MVTSYTVDSGGGGGCSEEVWPDAAGVDIRAKRAVHAVTVVRPGPRLAGLRQFHLLLRPESLPAVQELLGLLGENVLGEEDLVGAALSGAAFRARPGAGLEAATEAVLAIVALVVVGEETESKAVRATVLVWSGPLGSHFAPLTFLQTA